MTSIAIYSAVSILCSIGLALLPSKSLQPLTKWFSLGKKGIRQIRSRRDQTDTIANACLAASLLFSLIFWLIPGHFVIYGIFLFLTFLALLGQTNRISAKKPPAYRGALLFSVSLMFFFGLFSGLGCFNDFVTWKAASQFTKDLFSGEVFHIFYFLRNYVPMMVLLQGLCYLFPMYCLWAQIKYMRLENTYKGRNIGLFVVKILWLCLLMIVLSCGGVEVLNWAYYINYVEV